jgi:hypothetical protein
MPTDELQAPKLYQWEVFGAGHKLIKRDDIEEFEDECCTVKEHEVPLTRRLSRGCLGKRGAFV